MAAAAVVQPSFPEVGLEPRGAGYPGADSAGPSVAPKTRPTGKDVAKAFTEVVLTPDFWEKHWERYPLHLRAADGGPRGNLLPDAIAADDAADLIRRSGPSLKIFRRGDPCEEENFLVAYLDGASMIVNQADRYHPVVYEFSRVLAAMHFHHVFAVMYLTPPNS